MLGISLLLNYRLFRENKALKNSLPYLLDGEIVTYFDLINIDNKKITAADLNDGKLSLILVFQQPCSRCNESLQLWERLAKILSKRAKIYGVILDMNEMANFSAQGDSAFHLYSPLEPEKFKGIFRLRINIPQTIIYHNNKVAAIKMGTLSGDDFLDLLKKIKKLIKVDKS